MAEIYTPASPPPGWPLPVEVLNALELPRTFRFGSAGTVDEAGLELSVDAPLGAGAALSANYSWQRRPDLRPRAGERTFPINLPPKHRANAAVSFARGRGFGTLHVSFTDRAFWTDVLAIEGWTERFWLVNGSAGLRLPGTRLTWVVRGSNLADRAVQHHIFGDVIRRRIVTELRLEL
jgi:hypothetical protein